MTPGDQSPPDDPIPAAASASAPPTMPGRLSIPYQPAQWPGILGMICAILGGLALVGSLLSLAYHIVIASGAMDRLFASIQAAGPATNPLVEMQQHLVLLAVVEFVKLLLATLLLVVGVDMINRRTRAIPLATAWSVLKILLTFVGTAVGMWIQHKTLQATFSGSSVPPGSPAMMSTFMMSGAILGGLIAIGWGCALPAFLLIYLRRPRVRAEIARWRSPAL